jgi:hypothetical protein
MDAEAFPTSMPTPRALILGASLIVCGACHHSATAPSATTPDTSTTNLYQGSVDPGGLVVQTYTANVAGPLKLTLANVSLDNANQPIAQPLTLAYGSPNSDGSCAVTATARAQPGLAAQLTGNVQAGVFCVAVSDPDFRLAQTVNFFVQVLAGSPPSQMTTPGSSTWASDIDTNSSDSRSVTTAAGGAITLSLDSLSYQNGQLGVGIGVPGPGGSGCVLSQASIGGPSTTISAAADTGVFCVEVYDAGRTKGLVTFSTTITHS